MNWRIALPAITFLAALSAYASDRFPAPAVKEWVEVETKPNGEKEEVKFMTIDGIMVHETDPALQPPPPVVTPGNPAGKKQPAGAPSDAIVLFDGGDLSQWTSKDAGQETKWVVKNGAMMPTDDSGPIRTKAEFGSCQLHVEFATPAEAKGISQGRGNSGVFLMGQYEIQVLDNYENTTYPDGQCGALYGRHKPLANVCRKPGEWQSYDIVFHRPHFDENGEVLKRATFTVFHNGVLIHDHVELTGGTGWEGPHAISHYVAHGGTGPIELQDHGNPVLFRNVWIRPLAG
ncbi:MAG: DUF1080 domain-containing protein [Candidatus Hydrogenedentes bacterium]|nr:DUF1080 domain-containing protein [Candidatus Hydrogenedentota bacterium]